MEAVAAAAAESSAAVGRVVAVSERLSRVTAENVSTSPAPSSAGTPGCGRDDDDDDSDGDDVDDEDGSGVGGDDLLQLLYNDEAAADDPDDGDDTDCTRLRSAVKS